MASTCGHLLALSHLFEDSLLASGEDASLEVELVDEEDVSSTESVTSIVVSVANDVDD